MSSKSTTLLISLLVSSIIAINQFAFIMHGEILVAFLFDMVYII
jgi:hypothetical protein